MAARHAKPARHPIQALTPEEQARAEATLDHGARAFDEAQLEEVLGQADTVATKTRHLRGIVEDVKLLWRLLVDYARGRYRAPWRFIAAIGFAFLYLILPIDIIPDFLPGLGYIDDASVFAMVLRASLVEIAAYRAWLADEGKPAGTPAARAPVPSPSAPPTRRGRRAPRKRTPVQ